MSLNFSSSCLHFQNARFQVHATCMVSVALGTEARVSSMIGKCSTDCYLQSRKVPLKMKGSCLLIIRSHSTLEIIPSLSLFNLLVQNPKEKTSALIAQAISLSCTIYGHKKVQNWLWKNGSFCFQGWMRFHRETRSTLRGTTPLLRSLSTASSSLAEWTVVNAAFYHRQARIFTKSPLSSTPAFCALSWQKGRLPTEGASHPVLN